MDAPNWTRLYRSLSERWRPEDVAKALLESGAAWPPRVQRALESVIRRAWFPTHSSMSTRFECTRGPLSTIATAGTLFDSVVVPLDGNDLAQVEAYLDALNALLGRVRGQDFKSRPPKDKRHADWRHHGAFNKRWRLAIALERKLASRHAHARLTELAQVAKSRLAYRIAWEDFSTDNASAAFVAYFTATLNRRSTFTAGHQVRAFDVVAEALFDAMGPSANWWMVAHVHPDAVVLTKLTDAQRGELLGRWFDIMQTGARILGRLAESGGYDLDNLVVRRGNDSSTWNAAAGAYNKARDGWIGCLYAMDASELLDRFAPPKAMRLMAADVVFMHRHYGSGDLDPQTKVWRRLPKPWRVVDGHEACTRDDVERACLDVGVPASGWIRSRVTTAAPFAPTPELVHGVMVASPELAAAMRKAGWYAGTSKIKADVDA